MIHVLLVDDEARKSARIVDVINEAVGSAAVKVLPVASAAEAARLMESRAFDLLILDLNLPVKKGDPPRKDAGIRLLKQLLRAGPRFRVPQHIMGLTAYEDLADEFKKEFDDEGWQLVQFVESSEAWSTAVRNKLLHIAAVQAKTQSTYGIDLAIVTALKTIELDAVLRLEASWKPEQKPGDDTHYHVGTFLRGDASVRVVAAAAIEMGMAATASLAMKVMQHYRPRYIAMAGIAAGIGVNFGDIIVADQSWDYGSGKIRTVPNQGSSFSPAPNYIPLDAGLKEKLEFFASNRADALSTIQRRWPGNPVASTLAVRLGPVASGAAVVESEPTISGIREHNRKLLGVEMEIYGLYLATRVMTEPRPRAFAAKSACDFGVAPKDDEYQRYAAFTSANFVYEFALDQLTS